MNQDNILKAVEHSFEYLDALKSEHTKMGIKLKFLEGTLMQILEFVSKYHLLETSPMTPSLFTVKNDAPQAMEEKKKIPAFTFKNDAPQVIEEKKIPALKTPEIQVSIEKRPVVAPPKPLKLTPAKLEMVSVKPENGHNGFATSPKSATPATPMKAATPATPPKLKTPAASVGPKEPEYPAVGTQVQVIPSAVISANVWYGNVINDANPEILYDLQDEINLEENLSKFQEFGPTERPKEGELVLAKYDKDELYYRGKIESLKDGDNFSVFFLDYGNTEGVELTDLRKWDPKFNTLPCQAVRFVIANIEPIPEVGEEEAKDELVKALRAESTVLVKVISNSGKELGVLAGTGTLDIGDELVAKKMAKKVNY